MAPQVQILTGAYWRGPIKAGTNIHACPNLFLLNAIRVFILTRGSALAMNLSSVNFSYKSSKCDKVKIDYMINHD